MRCGRSLVARNSWQIAATAPAAWVVNFTNPAGVVTEVMSEVLGERVIGICDSPVGLCRRAARAVGMDPENADCDYVGINHLGWLRAMLVDGVDRLPDLLADPIALESFEEGALFGRQWLQALGSIPNEYLHYYYFTGMCGPLTPDQGVRRPCWASKRCFTHRLRPRLRTALDRRSARSRGVLLRR